MKQWDKKVLAVHMKWDYCDPARGPSPENAWFFANLKRLAPASEAFYYDEYTGDLPLLRRKLAERAAEFRPDLIFFVPFTGQFDAASLDALKAKWPTCAWFGDDTWRFESYSSRLAPHFTHVLTTDVFAAGKYARIGVTPLLTQWAAEPLPGHDAAPPANYRYQVSFVGGRNPVRAWFIRTLEGLGVKVDCFGAGWPAGRVSQEEMYAVFRDSRVNLNLSNSVPRDLRFALGGPANLLNCLRSKKTAEQIKARNFEIPLAGGFQLTNYVPGLERYLEIGREVAVFSTPEDCALQIGRYLSDEAERALVTAAGRARAAREHTYLSRLEKVLEALWPGGK